MKSELECLLREALRSLVPVVLSEPADPAQVVVERARDAQHGDFQSNIAMRIAKAARKNPRELAQALVAALPSNALIASAEVAGAGFINFRLAKDAWFAALEDRRGTGRGLRTQQRRRRTQGDGGIRLGQSHRARCTWATAAARPMARRSATCSRPPGTRVYREYYINDAGRQIDILAVSVYLRYLELSGESVAFPSNGYRAEYILPVARALHAKRGDALRRPGRGHREWRAARRTGGRQGQAHRRAHREFAPCCWARKSSIPSCSSRATR